MSDITGTPSDDILTGTPGDDSINGLGGNDQLSGADGADTLDGGLDDDTLDGGLGSDTLLGGDGNDVLTDAYGVNIFEGGAGNDSIISTSAAAGQSLSGGDGDDYLEVRNTSGATLSDGEGNNTFITISTQNVGISAGDGNDVAYLNNAQNSSVSLGNGNNAFNIFYNSGGIYYSGSGDDSVNSESYNMISKSIDVGSGNNIFYVQGNQFSLVSGDGNDRIDAPFLGTSSIATHGGDDIVSFAGSSVIVDLGGGNDTLTLTSGSGVTLTGGTGTDTFRFSASSTAIITDFTAGASGDILDIGYLLQSIPGYPGGNPFATGHIVLVQQGADTLLQIDQDGSAGGGTPVTRITLAGVNAADLTAYNFTGYGQDGSIDHAPVADAQSLTRPEGATRLMITLSGTDIDGDTLTFLANSLSAGSLYSAQFGGELLYVAGQGSGAPLPSTIWYQAPDPAEDFNGSTTLSFRAFDGVVASNAASVVITTTPINDLPTGSVTISGIPTEEQVLLASNTLQDVDGLGTITYQWLRDGGAITGASSATYTLGDADVGHTIKVRATYVDGGDTLESVTSAATAVIASVVVNHPPVAVADTGDATEAGTMLGSNAAGNVLSNDTDVDTGDGRSVSAVTHGAISGTVGTGLVGDHGTLTLNADGSYSYAVNDADPTVNGLRLATDTLTDTFSYTVQDTAGATSTTSLAIIIHGANDAPVAVADTGTVQEDLAKVFQWSDLFGNDRDPDANDPLTITSIQIGDGSVSFNALNKTVTYVADADRFDLLATGSTATDSFTYTVTDKSGVTSTATVYMTITGRSDGNMITGSKQADTIIVGTNVNKNTSAGEDIVRAGNGNDNVSGGDGADQLYGENGNDTLDGGNSIDKLFGGVGDDRLIGGAGNDFLQGDQGSDTLTGGAGSDTFIFMSGYTSSERDVISDLQIGDHLQLLNGLSIKSATASNLAGTSAEDTLLAMNNGSIIVLADISLSNWNAHAAGWLF